MSHLHYISTTMTQTPFLHYPTLAQPNPSFPLPVAGTLDCMDILKQRYFIQQCCGIILCTCIYIYSILIYSISLYIYCIFQIPYSAQSFPYPPFPFLYTLYNSQAQPAIDLLKNLFFSPFSHSSPPRSPPPPSPAPSPHQTPTSLQITSQTHVIRLCVPFFLKILS